MAGTATGTTDRVIAPLITRTNALQAWAMHSDALHADLAAAQHLYLLQQWVAKADNLLHEVTQELHTSYHLPLQSKRRACHARVLT